VYAVAGYALLVWRDRIPIVVFAVMCAHSVVAIVVIHDYRPVVGVLVALYTVSARASRHIGFAALALAFVPTGFGLVDEFHDSYTDRGLATLMIAVMVLSLFNIGAWLLGRWVHTSHRKVQLLERQREAAAREAAAMERGRLARELHDIIAHCVSIMLLNAAGARRMLASDPDRAAAALANIEHSGMQATGELRRLLGVLRTGDPVPADGEPGSQYGLADLEPLLDRVRAAGVPVRLICRGHPGLLDPSIELSAYRIVQEALTNVTKHAGRGADTTVELRWEDNVLQLSITDDGGGQLDHSPPAFSTGAGLSGLRERAAAVGGELHAAPLPGGGFRVTTSLPSSGRRDRGQHGRERAAPAPAPIETATDPSPGETLTGEWRR
ncbi:MAG: sensor histidine kinase, partial [Pseudonocardiaceae bacterium]